jgi:hypothetical protein
MPFNPRLQLPPRIVLLLQMDHDVDVNESALLLAQHPQDVDAIISELRVIMFRMSDLGDWNLSSRVMRLLHQARVISFRMCVAIFRRCAVLVDSCLLNFSTYPRPGTPLPSNEAMVDAVRACDDVLQFLPLGNDAAEELKVFYIQELRSRLMRFMEICACFLIVSEGGAERSSLSYSRAKRMRRCVSSEDGNRSSDSEHHCASGSISVSSSSAAKRWCSCVNGDRDTSCSGKENHIPTTPA